MQQDPPIDLERPDEHEAGAADELYCWMPGSEDRECSGSCVAYDASYEQDQRKDSCKVLNAIRSAGLSLGKLANMLHAKERQAAIPQPEPPRVQ